MINKKKFVWIIISGVLAVLTIITVSSQAEDMSIESMKEVLRNADFRWIVAAVVAMLGFIFFEGEAIRSILRSLGYRRSASRGLLFASADVYFSAITPSASGGQPASAYFMMKSNIPGPITTAVLILNLIMYTMAIITIGFICIITAPHIFRNFSFLSKILIAAGYIILIVLLVIFIILLTRAEILEGICIKVINLGGKLRLVRRREHFIEVLRSKMSDYAECVTQLKGNYRAIICSYFWNLAQRISQICVSVFIYMALGGKIERAYDIWVTQSMVAIGSNCVPIPGGMGVADYLMLDGFKGIMDRASAFQLELFSRSLSFYVCILISAVVVIIGYIIIKKKDKREMEKC